MDNYNKDWLNSANSYRPVEGANRLADQINAAMQELQSGDGENLDDAIARLHRLRKKCLELAPLTEDAPERKPIRRADGTGINPMGIGSEWAYAAYLLEVLAGTLREGGTLPTEEYLEGISQLAFAAASRSARRKERNSGS